MPWALARSLMQQDWHDSTHPNCSVQADPLRKYFANIHARAVKSYQTASVRTGSRFMHLLDEVGRPFVMSADVPAHRIAIMRKAFEDSILPKPKGRACQSTLFGRNAARVATKMATAAPSIMAWSKEIYEWRRGSSGEYSNPVPLPAPSISKRDRLRRFYR